ncbi:hypothetical protein GALMADRAFT_234998 [Galerina marginata CBS 339.88]|uniref:Shieldin complex subunit 2 first OB fold domain-containing protein n=1 Tax=Galerina marginata (strain CBS 339.88) TaxID=685588 RepID=A0A067U0Q2_GALM3|nr:hypothetical protein GALMADRAFT_234998 [Galerina marginata CBS 339.88]
MYRVFLGAPSKAEIHEDPSSYSWRTISSSARTVSSKSSTRALQPTQSVVLPRATLEAASVRISLIYKDLIFNDGPDEDSFASEVNDEEDDALPVERSIFGGAEQTTLISWPPTHPEDNDSRDSFAGPSFLIDKSSKSDSGLQSEHDDTQAVESQLFETQGAESQSFGNYSDASSIARFPSFHFNLHTLTSLIQLSESKFQGSRKVNLLLAVLEIEGPDTIRIKRGADAGKQVSILKMILCDEQGTVCKLTAWREIAEEWGGSGKAIAAKRGDIVHIENVMAACDPTTSITLSASPYLNSLLVICYRTMPYAHEDGRLRPDLRLGISDPSVRKVAAVLLWFEQMAGLKSA